jgi:hypothetical protein
MAAEKLNQSEWNLLIKVVGAGLKNSSIRKKIDMNVMDSLMDKIYDWYWRK